MKKKFEAFYEGAYARYILPGVLLQSVLIGGGYATGRFILVTAATMPQPLREIVFLP